METIRIDTNQAGIATTAERPRADHDRDYLAFERRVRERFAGYAAGPLFQTDATDLYLTYLDALPAERQVHTCLLPGMFIQGRIEEASKAHYSGEAVEITTANGCRLSLTGNHPVLTDTGFVAATHIIPGKKLLHYLGEGQGVVAGIDDEDSPAKIDDVFEALEIACNSPRTKVASPLDLHGDGGSIEGEIRIVYPDRGLLAHLGPDRDQGIRERSLVGPRVRQASLPGRRASHLDLCAVLPSATSFMRRGGTTRPLLGGHPRHLDPLGFAPVPESHPGEFEAVGYRAGAHAEDLRKVCGRLPGEVAFGDLGDQVWMDGGDKICVGMAAELDLAREQPTTNGGLGDVELVGQLRARFPGKVSLDDVISVRRFHYSGPVFDVGTDVGYFVASDSNLPNGLVISNCHACRKFFLDYGGLAAVTPDGRLEPAFWCEDDVPDFYRLAARLLARNVRRASIAGVFVPDRGTLGTPETGPWRHLHGVVAPASVRSGGVKSAGQLAAEKSEEYRSVRQALAEAPQGVLDAAVSLLESEALYRAERVLGPARWLADLQRATSGLDEKTRANLAWLAVAKAPAGFCHPRASVAWTLIEDLAAGMAFADVKRRFDAKMDPTKYQRPQAAPAAGNLAEAERVVARLGLAPALARRYARVEEVEALWRPAPPAEAAPAAGGPVFGHLTPKGAGPARMPTVLPPTRTMTWAKFAAEVLPGARSIEAVTPPFGPYAAITTAVDPAAPPILQWDRPDRRNPACWYHYAHGSQANQWGLGVVGRARVVAVALQPSTWGLAPGERSHQGRGVFFVLEGCRDSRDPGLAIFPETLRSELHGIRAAIEAYSNAGTLAGRDEATACGLLLQDGGGGWGIRLRVDTGAARQEYALDRWD